MKLYLARHCRTNYNELQLCNYDPSVDVHLTPTGIAQAKVLADKLKQVDLYRIFASELKRTQQTAEIINKFHNLTIEIDPRLNDHYSGFEGRSFQEYSAALNAAENKWTARLKGGQSIEDLKEWVTGFTDELRAKNYESVLVVTSQWVINVIVVIVQKVSYEDAWGSEAEQGSYIELEL